MRVKSEDRRQAILEIAKKMFSTQGVEQTSMSAIAKEVGGSKATLYNYFKSKEEIFAAVMDSCTTGDQIAAAFHKLSIQKPLRANLTEFGYNYLKCVLTPDLTAIYKMALVEAERSGIGRHFYENGPKKGWMKVSEFLEKQVEDKVIRPCAPWTAAMQLKALIEAELREPYELGIITEPDDELISTVIERAIDSFLMLYEIKRESNAG
jgi:AcrR family transcriptional regulator